MVLTRRRTRSTSSDPILADQQNETSPRRRTRSASRDLIQVQQDDSLSPRRRTRSTSNDPVHLDHNNKRIEEVSIQKTSINKDATDKSLSQDASHNMRDHLVDGDGGSNNEDEDAATSKKDKSLEKSSKDSPAGAKLTSIHATKAQAISESEGNELTNLIPGYTAPRKLNTSSLDRYRPTGGIATLRQQAQQTDPSTRDFVIGSTACKDHILNAMSTKKTKNGMLPKSYTEAYSSFKMGTKRNPDLTAGKGWFNMKSSEITDDIKTDMSIIQNRSYLDPKRFYKKSDKFKSGGIVQHGTVIEGATEFYSSRLTNKERRTNLTEEIMADPESSTYAKNKFKRMQQEKTFQALQRKKQFSKKKRKRGHY